MATIKEIAKECNVSIATVSNILNNTGRVGEVTRNKVLRVVEKFNYVPNNAAKTLKQKGSKTIGIITEDLTVFNTPEIVDGIDQFLEEKGYTFLLDNLRLYKKYGDKFYHLDEYWPQVEEKINVMKAKQAEGIIYVCAHSRDLENMICKKDLPIVLVYGFTTQKEIPSVIFHDEKAAYDAVEQLIKSGETRIGVIAGEPESIHTRDRLTGYQKVLYDAGVLYNPSLIVYSDWTRAGGYRAARQLLENGVRAVFSMNDDMAAGLYDYANEKGLVVGKDIYIIGIGSHISESLRPALTTMSLPLFEMGQAAANIMIQQLEEVDQKEQIYEQNIHRIECNLLKRESI